MAEEIRPHDGETFVLNSPLHDSCSYAGLDDWSEALGPDLLKESFQQWSTEIPGLGGNYVTVLFDGNGAEVSQLNGEDTEASYYGEALKEQLRAIVQEAQDSGTLQQQWQPFELGVIIVNTCLRAVPIRLRSTGRSIAVLGMIQWGSKVLRSEELVAVARHFRSCLFYRLEHMYIQQLMLEQQQSMKEAQRREALLLATKRLHDQINVTSVLNEIMHSLELLYPSSHVDLFLSQDYANVHVRVQLLSFKHHSNDICARSFLGGKPVRLDQENGDLLIAVPMAGKQAIYGVIRLTIAKESWEEAALPDVVMLAETAGSAFENAKLYEQSNVLIHELQLINELTKRLNQSLQLKEIIQFATAELLQIFHADYCCVLQYDKVSNEFVVLSTNKEELLNQRFAGDYGFCGKILKTKEALIVSDYSDRTAISSKLMHLTDSQSLIATPMLVNAEVLGAILLTHRRPHFFSYDNYKLLQVLATHIGLAITNASLHSEVRRMVITDHLTGLHARHYLDEQIQARQRQDELGALVLVDIDHFKQVNDTYGHQVGDEILTQVSGIIRSVIRDSDIAARWGGEELAVYLPKVTTEQASRVAERIRARVCGQTTPTVTVSCGVSEWRGQDDKISVESLFYRADMALYEAKKTGRNRVFVG